MSLELGPELRKFVAPECMFGANARLLAGGYARNLGATKVLVVTDPGVIKVGWAGDVISSLEGAELPCTVYDGVTSNPRADEVMAGAEQYHFEECDCIVAVGGGSPMDCAKGIGIVCTNGGHILGYEGVDEVDAPIPPLLCVPTTGGSSAEMSQFAMITDALHCFKIAIISKAIVPDVALVDPITLTTMPADLALYTGLDALSHAFESYVSNARSPLTDLFALDAAKRIVNDLSASIVEPLNIELKSSIAMACITAGMAFSNSGLGLLHAMSHALGGLLDTAHGAANGLLLPHVVWFNYHAAAGRYRELAGVMGLSLTGKDDAGDAAALEHRIMEFQALLGISGGLAEFGVTSDNIPDLAMKAIEDPDIATNPREPTIEDIEVLYERALR